MFKRMSKLSKRDVLGMIVSFAVGVVLMALASSKMPNQTLWLVVYGLGFYFACVGWLVALGVLPLTSKRATTVRLDSAQDRTAAISQLLWERYDQRQLNAILSEGLICKCGHKKSSHCVAPDFLPIEIQELMNHCHSDEAKDEEAARSCKCPAFLLADQSVQS